MNAVSIGQLLMDTGYIKHVADKKTFENGYYFYKFTKKARKLNK